MARDVKYDVHAETPSLKALRIFNVPATRDVKRRPRSLVLYDTVAAFVHATIDEVVAVLPPDGLLERDECFICGRHSAAHERLRSGASITRECSRDSDGVYHQDFAGMCGMPWRRLPGSSDELLTRLDVIMSSEFEAKLLGRVGRGHLPEIKFLKRASRWYEQEASFRWSAGP